MKKHFRKRQGKEMCSFWEKAAQEKPACFWRIWKRYTEYYDEHMPVPVYVPLAACTGDNGTGDAIRRYILEKLRLTAVRRQKR